VRRNTSTSVPNPEPVQFEPQRTGHATFELTIFSAHDQINHYNNEKRRAAWKGQSNDQMRRVQFLTCKAPSELEAASRWRQQCSASKTNAVTRQNQKRQCMIPINALVEKGVCTLKFALLLSKLKDLHQTWSYILQQGLDPDSGHGTCDQGA
jgi:hypothetical protein